MKQSFLKYEKPPLTVMVQAETPNRIEELMTAALPNGAEAFGMQFCKLRPEYRTPEIYKSLFEKASPLPTYVTNYRGGYNKGVATDGEIAEALVTLAECGATLIDVMGDLFDKQDDEMAKSPEAVEMQMRLISRLHSIGAEVLISSHIKKFTPAERVLEIALEHKRRGADISKIVVGADTLDEQIENLRIIRLLKEKLDIPFLLLSGGKSRIVRRFGAELGCCMYLCVAEHDSLATPAQPLLSEVKAIRDGGAWISE